MGAWRTISSLHIGHTSLLDALAAAFSFELSKTLLEMSSRVSAVLAGLLDVWELNETELSEGDSRLALRWWACCGRVTAAGEAAAGDRFLPLPRTRPPPSDLREVMMSAVEGYRGCSWGLRGAGAYMEGPGSPKLSDHAR